MPFVLLICSVFQPLQLLVCPKIGYPILWLCSLSGNAFPTCVGLSHKSQQAIFDHTDLIFHLPGSADFNRNAARQRTVPTATAWHGELANSLGPAKPPSITSLWAHRAAPDPTLWRDRWLPGPRRAPSLTKQNYEVKVSTSLILLIGPYFLKALQIIHFFQHDFNAQASRGCQGFKAPREKKEWQPYERQWVSVNVNVANALGLLSPAQLWLGIIFHGVQLVHHMVQLVRHIVQSLHHAALIVHHGVHLIEDVLEAGKHLA